MKNFFKQSSLPASGHEIPAKSREWKILVTFSCIIVLMLFIAFVILHWRTRVLTSAAENQSLRQVENLSEQISTLYSNFTKLGIVLGTNANLNKYAVLEENSESLLSVGHALRKDILQLVNVYGEGINMVAVYFPKSHSVVTMSRQLTTDADQLFFSFSPEVAPDNLQKMFTGTLHNNIFLSENERTWMIRHLNTSEGIDAYILLQYNLPAALERLSSYTDDILVMAGDAQRCFFSNTQVPEPDEFFQLIQDARQGRLELEDDYIASARVLVQEKIYILTAASYRPIQLIHRELILVMAIASLTVMGSLLFLLVSLRRRVFHPIEELIEKRSYTGTDTQSALQAVYKDLTTVESKRDQLLKERDYLVPAALGRLITRISESDEKNQSLAWASTCLQILELPPDQGFACFGLALIDDPKSFFSDSDFPVGNRLGKLHFFIDNILRDVLFEMYPGCVAPTGSKYFAVLVSCPSSEQLPFIQQAVQTLKDFCQENYAVILGSTDILWGSSPENLMDHVRQISAEVKVLNFWGGSLPEQKESENDSRQFYTYCHMVRKQISDLTPSGFESSWSNISSILDRAFPQNLDIDKIRYRIYIMSSFILSSIDQLLGQHSDFSQSRNLTNRLFEIDKIRLYRTELRQILSEIIEFKSTQEKNMVVPERMDDIRTYLQEHFTENDISVAGVAEEFEISVSYLSRTFKDTFGINLLEYIQRLRIDEAKKLLARFSVQSVAREVGFWDTQALTRAFKKYEGVTPADYKRQLEKEREYS